MLHLLLYRLVNARVAAAAAAPAPMKSGNGFALVLKSPYLRLIALFLSC